MMTWLICCTSPRQIGFSIQFAALLVILTSSCCICIVSSFVYDDESNTQNNDIPNFMMLETGGNRYSSNNSSNQYNDDNIDFDNGVHENILNEMMQMNDEIHRSLQTSSSDEVLPLVPDVICEEYNKATKGILNCTCSSFTAEAVMVNCSYVQPQCGVNSTFCFDGYIESIIQAGINRTILYNVTTSCSNITTSPTPEFVCIKVFPNQEGDYKPIGSCSAKYNGETCNDCSSCMPDPKTMANVSLINNTHIAINCCNVVDDKKQTCGSISDNGATVQQFDPIQPGKEGQCTGESAAPSSYYKQFSAALWISAVVLSTIASHF